MRLCDSFAILLDPSLRNAEACTPALDAPLRNLSSMDMADGEETEDKDERMLRASELVAQTEIRSTLAITRLLRLRGPPGLWPALRKICLSRNAARRVALARLGRLGTASSQTAGRLESA